MRYHVVGIAGAGMSAIAALLLDQGHAVSGSDMHLNHNTDALAMRGATVVAGHDPAHVAHTDAVVATSAVRDDHPEVAAAREAGIPVLRRVDIWQAWSYERLVLAIAGTHGKTTTTAMLAFVLSQMEVGAGYLIGATFPQLGKSAWWGHPSAPLLIEADEYDRAFLGLFPAISVVTNIEWDHPDIYPTNALYHAAFAQFLEQTRDTVVLSEQAEAMQPYARERCVLYGFGPACDYRAIPVSPADVTPPPPTDSLPTTDGSILKGMTRQSWNIVQGTQEAPCGRSLLTLQVPGVHNVRNALAVLAVVDMLGLEVEAAIHALALFRGVSRRFEVKGEVAGVTVVDDYAHHPSEAMATINAAFTHYPDRRLFIYMQPHTFSRTLVLLDVWPSVLSRAHAICIGNVYPSRENPEAFREMVEHQNGAFENLEEHLSQTLVQRIATRHDTVWYGGTIGQAATVILDKLQPGDVFITMGAGDSYRVGELVLRGLSGTV